MNKWITLLACSLLYATDLHVSVKAGDSFNTILRRNNISSQSINQINAKANSLQPLSSLKPNDKISLSIDDSTRKLISAKIHTKNRDYILNKEPQGFQIHLLLPQKDINIIRVSTEETTHNLDKIRAQRLSHMLFPESNGMIEAAITGDQIQSIKLLTQRDAKYAFLHQPKKGFPYFFDINGKPLMSALDRTPTNYKRISSPFNPKRLHPISKKVMPHKGVDLAAPVNTPVWAAASGKVIHRSSDTGYGNMLIIQHDNGLQTYYAHLNKFHNNIQPGQTVKAFETIGYVGSTGHSTGPHLHFETRLSGEPQDPLIINLLENKSKVKEILVPFYYF